MAACTWRIGTAISDYVGTLDEAEIAVTVSSQDDVDVVGAESLHGQLDEL